MFSKKQMKRLSIAVEYFNTVIYCNYKRCSPAAVNDTVADVWEEYTGKPVQRNWSCGKCAFDLFKEVGKVYFETIENMDDDVTETEPTDDNQEVKQNKSHTKNKGRKKSKK